MLMRLTARHSNIVSTLSAHIGVIIINVVYIADSRYAPVMVITSVMIARCVPGVGQIKIRR